MWIISVGSNTLHALDDAMIAKQMMQTAGFLNRAHISDPLTFCGIHCFWAGSMYIQKGKVTMIVAPNTKKMETSQSVYSTSNDRSDRQTQPDEGF